MPDGFVRTVVTVESAFPSDFTQLRAIASFWRDPCLPQWAQGVRMKKHERRSPFWTRAVCFALACAVFAPLGCSDEAIKTGSGGTGGTGATGGAGGTAGAAGVGGSAGTSTGAMCGGFASLQCPAPEATYCDYDDKMPCGQTDTTGVCTTRPANCTADCPGVCGCNGKFYCNACEANRDGTDIHPAGTCSDAGALRH